MKKSILFIFLLAGAQVLVAQNAPVDFEPDGYGADWTWTVFENESNPPLEIVANPDPSGINTSDNVAKFTALQAGAPFAGCETTHGEGIGTFTIDEENSQIRVMVWKSVISDVGIKLVRFDNWSLGEIKVANTVVNEWEQLTFDFSDHIDLEYDQIVFFPDFDERDQDNVIYWDNVFGEEATTINIEEDMTALPLISPNPANTVVEVRSSKTIEQVTIYNLAGQIVFQNQSPAMKHSIAIDHLPEGLYIVQSMIHGEIRTQKLVVK